MNTHEHFHLVLLGTLGAIWLGEVAYFGHKYFDFSSGTTALTASLGGAVLFLACLAQAAKWYEDKAKGSHVV